MDIETYRIIITIAKYHSFQKAAELFYVTAPAISHTVSQAEKELGFTLFKRNKQGVELTTLGESLYPYFLSIVKQDDILHQTIDEIEGLNKGNVKLGIFNSMCVYLFSIINSFKKDYPNITFEIFQGSYEDIITWLKDGTIDIGFLSKSINKDFIFHEIFSDPLLCITPIDYPTKSDTEIDISELKNVPFIMQRESCDADAKKIMKKMNLDISTTCHVVDDLTTVSMVKEGYGVAIMPALTMVDLEKGIKVLRITPEEKRVIGVVVKDEYLLSPAVKKVFEFIQNYNYERKK